MEEYEIRRDPALSSPQHIRSRARAPAEAQAEAEVNAVVETQLTPTSIDLPQHAAKATTACVRGKETSEVVTFRG